MRRLLHAAVLFLAATAAHAQTTQADLSARLLHKPLYLRGCYDGEKFQFDATGRPKSDYYQTSWTLSGIDIASVTLSGSQLQLKGERMATTFPRDAAPLRAPDFVDREHTRTQRITVVINGSKGGDFGPALDAIFADSLAALTPSLPYIWQSYAYKHFMPAGTPLPPPPPLTKAPGDAPLPNMPRGVQQPHPIHIQEPEFSEEARRAKFAGNVLVSLVVGTDGLPQRIQIIRPMGYGLDEKAVEAVSRYVFTPAMRDGQPVAVTLNVDVNFQIF